jgi:polyisoprenoid-binding protein YceI
MMHIRQIAKLFFLLSLITFSSTSWSSEIYQLDPNHTYVIWKVNHYGFSSVTGKFMASGFLSVDEKDPAKSSVDVTIQTGIMDTNVGKLNEVLQGKDYFDTSGFQTAVFKSTVIKMTGKSTGLLTGNLTIRGITKPVTLTVTLNQHGEHPYFHRDAYGFSATGMIKRSEFNMLKSLPGISDDVQLWIQAEAIDNK